jgi:hypothetical protein
MPGGGEVTKPFRDEAQYRHHAAIEEAISDWISGALGLVSSWWKPDYRVTEWWEHSLYPGRMIVNYDVPGAQESDGQAETALAILWSDDPQKEHDEVQEQLSAEHEARVKAARAAEKRYMVVPETEERERAFLRELIAKYPDEVKGERQ